MSYRHTLEATIENLHEIEDLIKKFPESGGIPAIEIDLVLQKLRNIYELMLIMQDRPVQTLPGNEAPATPLVESTEKTAITVSVEEKTGSINTTSTFTVEEKRSNDPVSDIQKSELTKTSKKRITNKSVQTLADQFMGRPTLHESLHETYNSEIRTVSHNKPIKDLIGAIGINDRYTFIRELFNNDSKAFESALFQLNNAPNYENACEIISGQFDWDMESEPVQQLLEILRRKYL